MKINQNVKDGEIKKRMVFLVKKKMNIRDIFPNFSLLVQLFSYNFVASFQKNAGFPYTFWKFYLVIFTI